MHAYCSSYQMSVCFLFVIVCILSSYINLKSNATLGKLLRDGVQFSELIDTVLNWTGIGSMFQVDCRLHFPPRRAYGLCVIVWVWAVRSCWAWETSNSPGLQIFCRYRCMLHVSFRFLESLFNSWGFCLYLFFPPCCIPVFVQLAELLW